ncbi:MAG: hypothetical protein WC204_11485 [Elusimicrobiales bacterium]
MKTLKPNKAGIGRHGAFASVLLRFFVPAALWLFASLPLFLSPSCAEVPVKFTYQGNLRQAGFLVNGQRSMVFRLYNSSTSGTELWKTDPPVNVSISTGVFRVTLEPVIADWQSGNLWLELEIDGHPMSPREELTSSPYSINTLMFSGKRYTTAVSSPTPVAQGDLWYDSAAKIVNFWNGAAWTPTSGTGLPGRHAATHSGSGSDPILSLGAHTVTGALTLEAALNPASNLLVGGAGYSVSFASSVSAGWYYGDGSGLDNLNASKLSTGSVSGDRIGNVIVSSHIVDGSILNQDLADGTINKSKLNNSGCANGQVLKWDIGLVQWKCANDILQLSGGEEDPLSIHVQDFLQPNTTFYASSGTVNSFNVNYSFKVMGPSTFAGTINPSSDLQVGGAGYSVAFASSVSAGWYYGDGSHLTNIPGDNLGNHTAARDLDMAGFKIGNAGAVTGSSFTATGMGIGAVRLQLADNVVVSSEANAALGGGVNISSNVYIVGFSSAARYYGDGSMLTGISGDNLGNHTAARDLDMAGFKIGNAGAVTGSSFTATGMGIGAVRLQLADNVVVSSEANAALGGGVNISSNVYIVGFSSAAKYYGDGSMLTGIVGASDNLGNHIATKNLNMSGFDIVSVSTLTVSSITTTAAGVTFSTNVYVNGNVGIGTSAPAAKLAVTGEEDPGRYIAVFNSGSKLAAWLKNK